jgi:hypothetical protein
MAALLPTILSDDEDSALISKKESKGKGKKSKKEVIAETDDESKASSGDEMDGDFEFGGMLVSFLVALHSFPCLPITTSHQHTQCSLTSLKGRRWIRSPKLPSFHSRQFVELQIRSKSAE